MAATDRTLTREAADRIPPSKTPAPGWVGGFAQSNPKFAYPDPDLRSLPMLANMDNINKLDRQMDVLWPEFTWLTVPGKEDSRCYQMFAPDISRAGYTREGRIYSIICPQQGFFVPHLGDLNIEVTVTGQRGWVDEDAPSRDADLLAADMTVTGKVWFGPAGRDTLLYHLLVLCLDKIGLPFPLTKADAIEVDLHREGDADQPILRVASGTSPGIRTPHFAIHESEAWSVANVSVGIGSVRQRGIAAVDRFNESLIRLFNRASGNILQCGNTLTWNVWLNAPTIVDRAEWKDHAERWRHSIDTGHGSPDGPGTKPLYFDGTPFEPFGMGDALHGFVHEAILDNAELISGTKKRGWFERALAELEA